MSERTETWANALLAPWLEEADPRALAVCRFIVFGFVWPGFRFGSVGSFAAFEGVSWHPIGILGWLHVPLFGPSVLSVLGAGLTLASGFALAGFCYRFAAPIAALLELYSAWVVQSSGKINHGNLLFTLVIFVLAFSRAADAWSLDAFIAARRGAPRPGRSAEYHWPVRFIALMIATMYGAAGLTKLVQSGFSWAFGDTLQRFLLSHHFTHHPPTELGVLLADYPLLCRVLAFLALCLELASPLALVNRALYRTIFPSLASLQLMIWLLLGVLFREMVANFACLLPWGLLIARGDALVEKCRVRGSEAH